MSIFLLFALAVALMAASAGATFLLASAVPQGVLQRAQDHGRGRRLVAIEIRRQRFDAARAVASRGARPATSSV